MTHNLVFCRFVPTTSAQHTAEGGWLCGRVAATALYGPGQPT